MQAAAVTLCEENRVKIDQLEKNLANPVWLCDLLKRIERLEEQSLGVNTGDVVDGDDFGGDKLNKVVAAQHRIQREHATFSHSIMASLEKNKHDMTKLMSCEDLDQIRKQLQVEIAAEFKRFSDQSQALDSSVSGKIDKLASHENEWQKGVEETFFHRMDELAGRMEKFNAAVEDIYFQIDSTQNAAHGRHVDVAAEVKKLSMFSKTLDQRMIDIEADVRQELLRNETKVAEALEVVDTIDQGLKENSHQTGITASHLLNLTDDFDKFKGAFSRKLEENDVNFDTHRQEIDATRETLERATEKLEGNVSRTTMMDKLLNKHEERLETHTEKLKAMTKEMNQKTSEIKRELKAMNQKFTKAHEEINDKFFKLNATVSDNRHALDDFMYAMNLHKDEQVEWNSMQNEFLHTMGATLQKTTKTVNEVSAKTEELHKKIEEDRRELTKLIARLTKAEDAHCIIAGEVRAFQDQHSADLNEIEDKRKSLLIDMRNDRQARLQLAEKVSDDRAEFDKQIYHMSSLIETITGAEQSQQCENKLAKSALELAEVAIKYEHFQQESQLYHPDHHPNLDLSPEMAQDISQVILAVSRILTTSSKAEHTKLILNDTVKGSSGGALRKNVERFWLREIDSFISKVLRAIERLNPRKLNFIGQQLREFFLKKVRTCLLQIHEQRAPKAPLRSSVAAVDVDSSRPSLRPQSAAATVASNHTTSGVAPKTKALPPATLSGGFITPLCVACDRPLDEEEDEEIAYENQKGISGANSLFVTTKLPIKRRSGNNTLPMKNIVGPMHMDPGKAGFIYRGGFRLPRAGLASSASMPGLDLVDTPPAPEAEEEDAHGISLPITTTSRTGTRPLTAPAKKVK